jgi:hypothetical protein
MHPLLTWIPVVFAGLTILQDSTPQLPRDPSAALWVNAKQLKVKDTFSFRWDGAAIGKPYPTATLHIWADHLESGRRWKFRYPVINGLAEGDLGMGGSLPPGTYALNFMVADQFFRVNGRIKKVRIKTALNHETKKRDTIFVYEYPKLTGGTMDYHLLGREGMLYSGTLPIGEEGEFHIPPIVFGDSAQLVFNPEKGKGNYWIDIETPLDSSFTPFYSETIFVRLEDPAHPMSDERDVDTSAYNFSFTDARYTDMLAEVKIMGKSNAQKFEDAYVSPMFKDAPGVRTIDGLDSDALMRSNDVFMYLRNNAAGLQMQTNGITRSFTWRGDPVSFFLNEMPVTADAIATLAPMDIALIKIYPPPAQMTSLIFGGAVAVYTKRGAYEKDPNKPKYNFMVRGFTQGEAGWGE